MSAAAVRTISLVVTDLDGTFWHTDDDIPPQVVAAAIELERRDVPLLVATGRRLRSTRTPLADVGLTPPAVVLNGALGVDLSSGDRFHRVPYPTEQAVQVLSAFAAVGLDPVVHVDHPLHDVYLSSAPSTHPTHAANLSDGAGTDDLERVVAEEAVLGFSLIGVAHGDLVRAVDSIGDLAETHLDRSLDFPGMATLTAAPRGLSKWDGVLAYCASRDLDPAGVLAVADGPNDLELLENAAVSLVPSVAHPAALERADRVIGAAVDGGWVEVLDQLS